VRGKATGNTKGWMIEIIGMFRNCYVKIASKVATLFMPLDDFEALLELVGDAIVVPNVVVLPTNRR
jgi:hypothetical protein